MPVPWTPEQQNVLALLDDALHGRPGASRLVLVNGPSCSGKSSLICEMAERVCDHFDDGWSALPVALTNAAGSAVLGRTVHSAFQIPISGELKPLSGGAERLASAKVLLIDEANLVDQKLLTLMDRRLREANGGGQSFGGRVVFAFGDRRAWGRAPFSPTTSSTTWSGFTAVELSGMHIQDASFSEALRRFAMAAPTPADIQKCRSRWAAGLPAVERALFREVPVVFLDATHAESYNEEKRRHDQENLDEWPETETASVRCGMVSYPYTPVLLWEGEKVMVTAYDPDNPEVRPGDFGHVRRFFRKAGPGGKLRAVRIRLENGRRVTLGRDPDMGTIPLVPAYTATSLPRALGIHFSKVVIELPNSTSEVWASPEYLYSALSRARDWNSLAFIGNEDYWDQWEEDDE